MITLLPPLARLRVRKKEAIMTIQQGNKRDYASHDATINKWHERALLFCNNVNIRLTRFFAMFFSVICACIMVLSLVKLAQAQDSDKVDLETYNAQLLNNIEELPPPSSEKTTDEIIGQSVVSTTSSAIRFDADLNSNYEEQLTSTTLETPRPRSADRTSQTSWSLNEDVPINDPELEAVFPRFAHTYNLSLIHI